MRTYIVAVATEDGLEYEFPVTAPSQREAERLASAYGRVLCVD